MNSIVIGLGNPILSDDGVGPRVAAELKILLEIDNISVNDIAVKEANTGGLGLLDLLAGYDRVIIIDAIQTVNGKAGYIYRLNLDSLNMSLHTSTLHDFDLSAAMKLGEQIGMVLPHQVDIFAIEADDLNTFCEECTQKVNDAIPVCAEMIHQELIKEKNELASTKKNRYRL